MNKKFALALPVGLLFALLSSEALFACTVTCGGTSCTGTAICSCDETGAHCEDYTLSFMPLGVEAPYTRGVNAPSLNLFAGSGERMAAAPLRKGDQDDFFVALLARDPAPKS